MSVSGVVSRRSMAITVLWLFWLACWLAPRAQADDLHLFNASGDFLQLHQDGREVLTAWNIDRVPGLGAGVIPTRINGPRILDLAVDTEGQVLYLLLPVGTGAALEVDPVDGEEPATRYRLVSTTLPALLPLAEVEVITAPGSPFPRMLLAPDRGPVLIQSYGGTPEEQTAAEGLLSQVTAYDPVTLVQLWRQQTVTARDPADRPEGESLPLWTRMAHFTEDSRVVWDGDRVVTLGENRLGDRPALGQWIPLIDVGSDTFRQRIDALGSEPFQGMRFRHAAVDSFAGQSLVKVLSPSSAAPWRQELYSVLDLATGERGAWITAPLGLAGLTDGGRQVWVLEVDPESERHQEQTTGRLLTYDATTGELVATLEDRRLAGPLTRVRRLCGVATGADSPVHVFRDRDNKLLLVDPNQDRSWRPKVGFFPDNGTRCF